MSLFDMNHIEMPVCMPQYASKNEKFRCQIRRKQHQQKFKSIRRQLIESLKSLNFLEELKSERDNLTSRKIQWMIRGLQNGKNSASFYQQMLDMRLEPYLCDMAYNKQITLIDKNKIINSLVQLTYFTSQFSADFNDSKFIDQMRLQLSKLDLGNDIDYDYAYYVSTLIQNLTAFQNKQFNNFMVESDFLLTLKKLIDQPTNDPKQLLNAADLRLIWLKIYKNLVLSNQLQYNYICKTFVQILEDFRNFQSEDKIVQIFKCLREVTQKQGFWEYVEMKRNKELGIIMEGILDLVKIMTQSFGEKCFEGFVNFMDQLKQSDQITADDLRINLFERIIELHPQFWLNSIKQLNRNQESGSSKRILCKTLKVLSSLQFNRIYSTQGTKTRKTQFIQCILAKYIFTHCTYGKYAVRVLSQMLGYDKTIIDVLIDFGIVDGIRDFLDCKFFTEEKVDIIKLAEQLIDVEQELKQARSQNKVINCFQGRGIVRDIEQLQNDPNRQVYKRAEQFMSRLSALLEAHQSRR